MVVDVRKEKDVLKASIVIALLLQLPLFWFIAIQTRASKTPAPARRTLSPLTGVLIPQKRIKKVKKEKPPKGQIVELPEEIRSKKAPEHAKYLSKFNTKVKKQTRARHATRHRNPRHAKPAKRVARLQSPDSKSLKPTHLHKKQAAKLQNPRKVPLAEKGVLFRGDRVLKGLKDVMLPGNATNTMALNVQSTVGRLSSNDAILNQPKSDETLLNSRRFKYWAFFQRVKRQVEAQWKPGDAVMEWDPKLKQAGRKDRLTILKVTIDKKGKLLRSEIVKESGISYLDREALRAFKAAQPFVNPPGGLMDKHGRLTFNFGFLVEMSGGPVRFFWRH